MWYKLVKSVGHTLLSSEENVKSEVQCRKRFLSRLDHHSQTQDDNHCYRKSFHPSVVMHDFVWCTSFSLPWCIYVLESITWLPGEVLVAGGAQGCVRDWNVKGQWLSGWFAEARFATRAKREEERFWRCSETPDLCEDSPGVEGWAPTTGRWLWQTRLCLATRRVVSQTGENT